MSMRGKWLRPGLSDRFHSRYIPEPNSGCWIWLGKLSAYGYGLIPANGNRKTKELLAHRVSVELSGRTIPPKHCACHKCDTPSCVNPDHLFIGTKAQNSQDMAHKGRSTKAERNPQSKLTLDQVLAIRADIATPATVLATQYGVTQWTIRNYRSRRTWKDA